MTKGRGTSIADLGPKALAQVAHKFQAEAARKPSKYGNKIVEIDGLRFHSQGEANRWFELKLLQRSGAIYALTRQRPIELGAREGEVVGLIVIDFAYFEISGRQVFEDFKGFTTPLAKWKLKHLQAQYPSAHVRTSHANPRSR